MRELKNFDACDGHIESVLIGCQTAKVSFQKWDAKKLVLIYENAEEIEDKGSVFSEIGEYRIQKLDNKCFECCFVNANNCLVLRIVAQAVKIFEVGEGAEDNEALFDVGYEYIGGQVYEEYE